MHLDRFLFCGFQPGSCLSDAIPGVGNGVIILVALFRISCKYSLVVLAPCLSAFFPSLKLVVDKGLIRILSEIEFIDRHVIPKK